jgi:hypothetical protein
MNLPQLHSEPEKRNFKTLRAALAVSTVVALFFLFGSSRSRLFPLSVQAARGMSEVFQDELKIQLGSGGFTPPEVQHAAGTFVILVENSAISGEYTLRLKAADGTVLKEVQVQKGSAAWSMTLATGEYTLTETSHPQWSCRITVQ